MKKLSKISENTPKRILVYGMTCNRGGIETYLFNYQMELAKRNNIIFDFVTDYDSIAYQDELEEMGCKIYYIPKRKENLLGHMSLFRFIVKMHPEYEHIYFNILSASEVFTVLSACGLRNRRIIVHSHNNSVKSILRHKLLRPILNILTDVRLACSVSAGEFMFGKRLSASNQMQVINNAIVIDAYLYDERIREQARAEEHFENKVVIGHVGRMCHQKNTLFLIDIFKCVHQKNKNTVLVIVGGGEDRPQVEQYIYDNGLQDVVYLYGVRKDVPRFMQLMDVFVLPSRFEGLPIVGVEAQTSGLHCVFSNNITEKADVTGNVTFLSLEDDLQLWANTVLTAAGYPRMNMKAAIEEAGYNIQIEVERLEKIFLG